MRRILFLAAHEVGYLGFYRMWRRVHSMEMLGRDNLASVQSDELRSILKFAFHQVPFYRDYANGLGLVPEDIRTADELIHLPIITRQDVRERFRDFCPAGRDTGNYLVGQTGGTTGTPMEYRLSQRDRFLGGAIMYRGWGYAGYGLGDSMVVLGGRSLGIGGRKGPVARVEEFARNLIKLSAFDMSEPALHDYISCINRVRPAFVRGYPGALQVLAQYSMDRKCALWSPQAVFTTSEMLLPQMRTTIQEAFGCPVFDGYGLNDGGVSAYECEAHFGLHIDTERSILQVVDEGGVPVMKGIGRVIATTLTNYAMPLLRYDTGDMAEIDVDAMCSCGRPRPLLKRILGRSTDVLVTPEGTKVHGWFFLYMFWELGQGIREYQVVQETLRDISIRLVPGEGFNPGVIESIRHAVVQQSPEWVVRVELIDDLPRTEGGKAKFIENRVPST